MSVSRFRALPIFRPDPEIKIGVFTRGQDAHLLTKAITAALGDGPNEAARALGDPASATRRAQALRLLEALPARQQQRILTAYLRSTRTPGEAA